LKVGRRPKPSLRRCRRRRLDLADKDRAAQFDLVGRGRNPFRGGRPDAVGVIDADGVGRPYLERAG
jgi:hypothetical protein